MQLDSPTPEQIKAARAASGLTQKEAAALIGSPSYITWQNWELGKRKMPPGLFELFLLKSEKKGMKCK